MDIVKQLKQALQEAELYRTQGLLDESERRYQKALDLIGSHAQLKSNRKLAEGISRKMESLKSEIERVTTAPVTPEQSAKVQDLIKKLFAFPTSQGDDAATLDGAIALAKFGQFERALEEFEGLLAHETLRVPAAKNIFKCHLELTEGKRAVERFSEWMSADLFSAPQLAKLRAFLEVQLRKNGIEIALPEPAAGAVDGAGAGAENTAPQPQAGASEPAVPEPEEEEEILDINSIGITMPSGPQEGELVEFGVSFQSGNVISLLLSGKEKKTAELFTVGDVLDDMQFYSPIAMFNGSGVISGKTVIESGPRRGDYSLDIRVSSN